jgi:beta-lactamase regulating signal transducer with metallopeptidase domain
MMDMPTMLAPILMKVTVVLAVAVVAAGLARRSSAAVRHVILAAAFVVMLVLPFASLVAPKITVTVPVAVQEKVAPYVFPAIPLSVAPTEFPSAPVSASAPEVAAPRVALSTLLVAVWAIVSAGFLLPIGAGLWQVRVIREGGTAWSEGQSILYMLAADAGIRRRVRALLSEALSGPMTCGVVRPAVLLPSSAPSWSGEDLRRALIHELEHVRRFDWVTHCFARTMRACYWFHPLAWIALRRLTLEAECACDDAVLRRSESTAYADQLVGLAERLSKTSKQPLPAMASPGDLTMRVRAILDQRQRRTRAGRLRLTLVIGVAASFVITVSSLRMVSQAQPEPAPQPKTEVAAIVAEPPVAPPQAPAQAAAAAPARLELAAALAQSPATFPGFEVVSVRPCDPNSIARGGERGANIGTASPATLRIECQTVFSLIRTAYVTFANGRVNPPWTAPADPPSSSGPEWLRTERFTVEATTTEAMPIDVIRGPMLQAALEDRFKLKVRRESREVPIYEMVLRKGGHKLTPFKPGVCVPYDWSSVPQPPLDSGQRRCTSVTEPDHDNNWVLTVEAQTLD